MKLALLRREDLPKINAGGGGGAVAGRRELPAATDAADAVVVVSDRYDMRGSWLLVSAETDGRRRVGRWNSVHFVGDDWTAGEHVFAIRLNELKRPKQIDWILDGQLRERGIYELQRDRLTLCLGPRGGPRPTEFATSPGDGRKLHVRERVKKAARKAKR